MSGTDKEPDFNMFRATLTKLERLIGIWTKQNTDLLPKLYSYSGVGTNPIGESMIHTLKLLIKFDINTSESNAIEELEHLATIRINICGIPLPKDGPNYLYYCASKDPEMSTWGYLECLTKSKIAFLEGRTVSRLVSEGGVEPMTALDRLTDIQMKLRSVELSKLLTLKMNEVVYTCEAKASTKIIPIIREQPHLYIAAIGPSRHRLLAQRGGSRPRESISSAPCKNPSLTVHLRLLKSKRPPIATNSASARSQRQRFAFPTYCLGLKTGTKSRCNGFRSRIKSI